MPQSIFPSQIVSVMMPVSNVLMYGNLNQCICLVTPKQRRLAWICMATKTPWAINSHTKAELFWCRESRFRAVGSRETNERELESSDAYFINWNGNGSEISSLLMKKYKIDVRLFAFAHLMIINAEMRDANPLHGKKNHGLMINATSSNCRRVAKWTPQIWHA